MFSTLLIAKRGEVASRVARSCRQLDIRAVALATAPDERGVHVDSCDEVLQVEAAPDGSLDPATVAGAAKKVGVDAVYPGYASSDSNLPLRQALASADVNVVGATPESVEALANPEVFYELATNASLPIGLPEGPVERARIVGVLVAADHHGNVIALCDADRSLVQSLAIEESPSPQLSLAGDGEAMRGAMFETAQMLMRQSKCTGIARVDFAVDRQLRVWLNQISVGLPRQHTVMEMVTGLDFVALQIQIAAGEKLPQELELLQASGHAMEASVLLEGGDGDTVLEQLTVPPAPQGQVRFQPSVVVDGTIPVDDFPCILKVSVRTPLRHRALLTLDRMLAEMVISPVDTNIAGLRAALGHFSFRAGQYDNEFAKRYL